MMPVSILSAPVQAARDGVTLRQRSRRLAQLLGFTGGDCVRIATSVSEIARTVYSRGRRAQAEFLLEIEEPQPALVIRIADAGGRAAAARAGAGADARPDDAIVNARRLMDGFEIQDQAESGTRILLKKLLPAGSGPFDQSRIAFLREQLQRPLSDVLQEVEEQDKALTASLEELCRRQAEIGQLNRELAETNRGVVALSAELEEKAEQLKAANEMKGRFLSHASHEFRTPLNGIIGLTRLLLNSRADRPEEEKRQLAFILRSAEDLTAIVDDLLDLAKAESGKIELHPTEFEMSSLFGAMRGLFRPLQSGDAVALIFEEPAGVPALLTDEGKVNQIVRNLVSNALKFTEKGEVRVSARYLPGTDSVRIDVQDTGIGIPPEHLTRVFEEFSQIDNPMQRRVKGTGLGLPLVRRLAELLGGGVTVQSEPGAGSTFTVHIARRLTVPSAAFDDRPASALIIDDEEIARYILRQRLPRVCKTWEAADGQEGLQLAAAERPEVIFLDLNMPGMNGRDVLADLRRDPDFRGIPVIVVTAQPLSGAETEELSALGAVILHKSELARSDRIAVDPGPPVRLHLHTFPSER